MIVNVYMFICTVTAYTARDLVSKMLQINPKRRYTVKESMVHVYFEKVHVKENLICDYVHPYDFNIEKSVGDDVGKWKGWLCC